MRFYRIKESDIDWMALDGFHDRMFSQTRKWIDFVVRSQEGEAVFAVLCHGAREVGYFSGVLVRKLGVPILGSPFVGWTTPYMGFNLKEGVSRKSALAGLERFAFDEVKCQHLEIKDRYLTPEDGADLGFEYNMNISYLTDLRLTEEKLFASMSSACRRCIRKAQNCGVTIEECRPDGFAEEYYDQLVDVFAKQHLKPTYNLDRVHNLIDCLYPTGRLLLLRARDPLGRSIATGIYPGLNPFSFFWGNASYRQHQHLRPNEALHWHAMRYWKRLGMRWHDWGGGGNYKKKYGVQEIHIPHFRKSRTRVVSLLRAAARTAYYAPREVLAKWS